MHPKERTWLTTILASVSVISSRTIRIDSLTGLMELTVMACSMESVAMPADYYAKGG